MTEPISTPASLAVTGRSSAPSRAGYLPSADFRRTLEFFNALSVIDQALDSHWRFLTRGGVSSDLPTAPQVQERLIEAMRRAFDLETRHERGDVDRASLPEWVHDFGLLIGPLIEKEIPAAVSEIIDINLLSLGRLAAPSSAEDEEERHVSLAS